MKIETILLSNLHLNDALLWMSHQFQPMRERDSLVYYSMVENRREDDVISRENVRNLLIPSSRWQFWIFEDSCNFNQS